MSDIGETVIAAAPPRGGSLLGGKLAIVIALAALLVAGGGGAAYFFLLKPVPPHGKEAAPKEAPLPVYLEIKPFVVSMSSNSGASHFVQLGVDLTVSGSSVGNLVNAMLPEVQDTMRLSVLAFKVDEITTPAGVDKMRAAMTAGLNRMLLQRLGPERIERINGGSKTPVQNIYFSTLVIE